MGSPIIYKPLQSGLLHKYGLEVVNLVSPMHLIAYKTGLTNKCFFNEENFKDKRMAIRLAFNQG